QRLAQARLYVLIDGAASLEEFQQKVSCLVSAGASVLQLRDKHLPDRELLSRARLLRQLTHGTPTLCILNDRPDLALLADADGVHLGQDDLPVKEARRILGPDRLIGVSTHSLQQAEQAVLDGANYIGVGPTFPSSTKEFTQFPGLELLRQVADCIRLPAFAIGGVTLENLPLVLQTGIRRVAVLSAIWQTSAPGEAAQQFLAYLHECTQS
ncbi:MAG TPA: thiamine phosphate synthase, partial [Thermoguttaceae bacterium]|nr:thiamine phosphate synthase [Thermoguttaceae bacterium]